MPSVVKDLASYCERLAEQNTNLSDLQLLLATAKDLARHNGDPKLDRAVSHIETRIRLVKTLDGRPMIALTPVPSAELEYAVSHPFIDHVSANFASSDARSHFVSFARTYLQDLLRWRPDFYDYRVVDVEAVVTLIFSSHLMTATLTAHGSGFASLQLTSKTQSRVLSVSEIADRPTMLDAVAAFLGPLA